MLGWTRESDFTDSTVLILGTNLEADPGSSRYAVEG